MMEATEKDIGNVIGSLVSRFEDELFAKKMHELEENYFFKWDQSASLEQNTYAFHDMLSLYGHFCRRWEEHHNGSVCIVERIRDKYLMPKIKKFVEEMTGAIVAAKGEP